MADAFGEDDVKRDQEDIGHGEFAQDVERGQGGGAEQVPVDQSEACGLGIGREDGEEGDQQGERRVGAPQGLQSGDHRDFIHAEDRQQGGAQQGGEPGHGEQDQQGEIGVFHGVRVGCWRFVVKGGACGGGGASGGDIWGQKMLGRGCGGWGGCDAGSLRRGYLRTDNGVGLGGSSQGGGF